ncbi:uncharacterized protein [Amphiura filiformis]|uniref:uncharacterized protein n=1 Tax=Amphiura filiformis TaxID=82378 RepID=UPI003B218841
MGKSSKKFVPPLKSSQNVNIDQNGNHIKKTDKLSKSKKKKLIVNFDYSKMKKQHASKKQAVKDYGASEEEGEIIEVNADNHSTTQRSRDVTSSEFMWFEPIQEATILLWIIIHLFIMKEHVVNLTTPNSISKS